MKRDQTPVSDAEVDAVLHVFHTVAGARRFLAGLTLGQRARFIRAARNPDEGGFLHDPIEDEPSVRGLIQEMAELAETQVQEACGGRLGMGSCHLIWEKKARLLSERYGIEWMSPSMMNPDVLFD